MTSEQYTFAAQDQKFSVTVVRKKVKNINLHIRNDGNLFISASPRVPWAYIEAFLQKKERPYLPGRTEVARTAEKVPFPDIERRRNPLDYGETLPSRRPSGPSQYHPAKSGHGIYGAQGRYASDPAEAVSSAAAAHRSPSFFSQSSANAALIQRI